MDELMIYAYFVIVDESDKDYLGVRDFRLIHTLLQVIISWGFYPCFLPGVGVPLSKRVKSGYTNHGMHCRCAVIRFLVVTILIRAAIKR